MTKRIDLCYVLPLYDINTEQHFNHIYKFIEKLTECINVYLIIEKSNGRILINSNCSIYIQKYRNLIFRAVELFLVLVFVRIKGCKKYYIHYSSYAGVLTPIILRILGGTSYYWHCEEIEAHFTSSKYNKNVLYKRITREIPFILILKLNKYLVTGTKSMAEYYNRHYNKDLKFIKVIPNYIDETLFNTHINRTTSNEIGLKEKRIVVFVHSLNIRKGVHHIVKIAEKVIGTYDNLLFFIIGDGPYYDQLQKEIGMSKIRNSIKLLGKIPNRQIPEYLICSDLLINPSEQEGFPRVLIESMAMGVPFVATDVGGVKDIVVPSQTEYIVQKGDIESFSLKVIDLLKDDAMRERLIKVGLEKVKEYTLEKAVERFKEIIY